MSIREERTMLSPMTLGEVGARLHYTRIFAIYVKRPPELRQAGTSTWRSAAR